MILVRTRSVVVMIPYLELVTIVLFLPVSAGFFANREAVALEIVVVHVAVLQ